MVKPGENVNLRITIKNTGDESHRFFVGATFRHIKTNKDFDLDVFKAQQGPGSEDETSFNWTVTENAPKGAYSVIGAVWENFDDEVLSSRLDDDVIPNAFIVE